MSYQALPVKRLGDVFLGKMIQPEAKAPTDVQAPYLRAAHVQPQGQLIDVDDKTMWFDPVELARHDLRPGDLVVVEGGAGFGRSAVVGAAHAGWGFQNSIVRVRPRPRHGDGRFIDYALQSALRSRQIEVACFTSTIPHFTAEKVGALPIPAPPLREQRDIADYLDRETAQIDALIGKQERLIDTLRERRSALISRAFYRLGNETMQLRRVISFLTSGSRGWADYYADEGERFLRIGNLPRAELSLRGEVQHVDLPPGVSEGERTRLKAGDLLFSITAYLGSVAVVSDDWIGAYVSQHVALCRLRDNAAPAFVGWFMLSREGQRQLKQGAAGGTKQQLSLPDIRELRIPLPPLDEQRRIAAHLDEQTAKIDALIVKAERFIALSKERRAALITAAVAGQLDLRSAT